jgi:hypothetical protein
VAAIQLEGAKAQELEEWLAPIKDVYPVLATISDGEKAIVAAMERCWPEAAHQRCQAHFLGNLAEPLVTLDAQLREKMRDDLGGLPPVPEQIWTDQGGKKEDLLQEL